MIKEFTELVRECKEKEEKEENGVLVSTVWSLQRLLAVLGRSGISQLTDTKLLSNSSGILESHFQWTALVIMID